MDNHNPNPEQTALEFMAEQINFAEWNADGAREACDKSLAISMGAGLVAVGSQLLGVGIDKEIASQELFNTVSVVGGTVGIGGVANGIRHYVSESRFAKRLKALRDHKKFSDEYREFVDEEYEVVPAEQAEAEAGSAIVGAESDTDESERTTDDPAEDSDTDDKSIPEQIEEALSARRRNTVRASIAPLPVLTSAAAATLLLKAASEGSGGTAEGIIFGLNVATMSGFGYATIVNAVNAVDAGNDVSELETKAIIEEYQQKLATEARVQ